MRLMFFRADGGPLTGYGHIRRCLSIADAARRQGVTCVFVCADETPARFIELEGFACDVLHTDYRDMEGEAEGMCALTARMAPDIVVVDSYFVTPDYLATLNMYTRTALMDDGALIAYPTDVLINYNLAAESTAYRKLYAEAGVPEPLLLIGPSYAPLRRMFAGLQRHVGKRARNVLVTTGGADPTHAALRLVRYMREDADRAMGLTWHIVCGALSEDKEELRFLTAEDKSFILYEHVDDMARLMCDMDIAVSAAGSTLYELCCAYLPTVAFLSADNQEVLAKAFTDRGIMLSGGDSRGQIPFEEELLRQVRRIAEDTLIRQTLIRKSQAVTDGYGAERIVGALTA